MHHPLPADGGGSGAGHGGRAWRRMHLTSLASAARCAALPCTDYDTPRAPCFHPALRCAALPCRRPPASASYSGAAASQTACATATSCGPSPADHGPWTCLPACLVGGSEDPTAPRHATRLCRYRSQPPGHTGAGAGMRKPTFDCIHSLATQPVVAITAWRHSFASYYFCVQAHTVSHSICWHPLCPNPLYHQPLYLSSRAGI